MAVERKTEGGGPTAAPGEGRRDAQRRADDAHADRALIALLVCLALALAGWLLIRKMSAASKLQDCVMSGRGNCAPVDPDTPAK